MRKLILIAFILQVCCYSVSAQVSEDHLKVTRNYISDRLSFLRIELLERQNSLQGKATANFEAVQAKLKDVKVTSAIDKAGMDSLIAKDFKGVWSKLSVPLFEMDITPFKGKSPEDAASAMTSSALRIFGTVYPKELDAAKVQERVIQQDVAAYLKTVTVPSESSANVVQPVPLGPGSEETEEPGEKPGFFDMNKFNFWTLLPLLLVVGCIIFVLRAINDIKYKLSSQKSEKPSREPSEFEKMRNTPNSVKAQVQEAIANDIQIQELKRKLDEVLASSKKSELPPSAPPFLETTPAGHPEKQEQTSSNDVFYMSQPTKNYFSQYSRSDVKENTLYKFFVKANNKEAEFEVHNNGVDISEVLPLVARYIDPACIQENSPARGTRRIKTVEKGKVILEGDKWVIQNKASIRYE